MAGTNITENAEGYILTLLNAYSSNNSFLQFQEWYDGIIFIPT